MKAYMELKDILARTKFGTIVYLIDLKDEKIINNFVIGKFNYMQNLSREILDAEPFDFSVSENCFAITICKDED